MHMLQNMIALGASKQYTAYYGIIAFIFALKQQKALG